MHWLLPTFDLTYLARPFHLLRNRADYSQTMKHSISFHSFRYLVVVAIRRPTLLESYTSMEPRQNAQVEGKIKTIYSHTLHTELTRSSARAER